ncbi:hypothetical protein STPH1_1580 [Streptomyces sp. OM5714]|nr:hypothetical protein STPH1_1580 [Streptomyces sp. OM5714]
MARGRLAGGAFIPGESLRKPPCARQPIACYAECLIIALIGCPSVPGEGFIQASCLSQLIAGKAQGLLITGVSGLIEPRQSVVQTALSHQSAPRPAEGPRVTGVGRAIEPRQGLVQAPRFHQPVAGHQQGITVADVSRTLISDESLIQMIRRNHAIGRPSVPFGGIFRIGSPCVPDHGFVVIAGSGQIGCGPSQRLGTPVGGGSLVPCQGLLWTPGSDQVAGSHEECVVNTLGCRALEPHKSLVHTVCLR